MHSNYGKSKAGNSSNEAQHANDEQYDQQIKTTCSMVSSSQDLFIQTRSLITESRNVILTAQTQLSQE